MGLVRASGVEVAPLSEGYGNLGQPQEKQQGR